MKISTKRAINILGKEEVTSSNLVIGSFNIKELRNLSDSFLYSLTTRLTTKLTFHKFIILITAERFPLLNA